MIFFIIKRVQVSFIYRSSNSISKQKNNSGCRNVSTHPLTRSHLQSRITTTPRTHPRFLNIPRRKKGDWKKFKEATQSHTYLFKQTNKKQKRR